MARKNRVPGMRTRPHRVPEGYEEMWDEMGAEDGAEIAYAYAYTVLAHTDGDPSSLTWKGAAMLDAWEKANPERAAEIRHAVDADAKGLVASLKGERRE